MGRFRYQGIAWEQDGQRDPGCTTDSPRGSLQTTTFANEPRQAPKAAPVARRKMSARAIRAVPPRDLRRCAPDSG